MPPGDLGWQPRPRSDDNDQHIEPIVDIRRADDRDKTKIAWLDSKHSFSFGSHYDPANTHHGLLLVNNDDTVKPGRALRPTRTATWRSSPGCCAARWCTRTPPATPASSIPGLAQRMSAGRGILHSEKNDSWTLTGDETHSEPVHFVQMWVVPDESGIDAGLPAAGNRRRAASRQAGDHRLGYAASTTTRPPSPSRTSTPRCGAPGCSPARASSCPMRRICICSSRVARSPSRARASCMRVTRCGSPLPADNGSPPPNRPRSWSGRCMRGWLRLSTAALAATVLVAACASPAPATDHPVDAVRRRRAAARRRDWSPVTVAGARRVCAAAPFDVPRQAMVPPGWTMSVWARVPKARLAAWTPDGALLVSLPSRRAGRELTPSRTAHPQSPCSLADWISRTAWPSPASRSTSRESDQIDAYDYAGGAATGQRARRRRPARRQESRPAGRVRARA